MSYPKMKSPYRPDSDRRQFFRHNTIVPIDYYPEGSRVSPTPKPTKVNLSGGGIRFATQRMFRVGDRLEVVLALPTLAPLHVTAEIIHVRPDDLDDSAQVVRCRFVSMTQRSRERVIQFLLRSQAFQLQEADSG
ncbi:MAG: PilZ domain-containing protein [Nitrospirae bacterium]|nr:PilZ domain-containing protein [Nitrospirota bacterium]